MLAEKNEFIKQSIVTLQELTADEKARMQMEARERYRRDLAASKELGKQESEEMIQLLKGTIGEQQGTIEEQKHTIQQVQEEKERVEAEKERAEAEKEKALEKNKQFEAKTKEADEEIQRLRKILEEHGLLEDDK